MLPTIVETVLFGGLLVVMLGVILPAQLKQRERPRHNLRMSVIAYISIGAVFEIFSLYVSHSPKLAFLGFLCFLIGIGVGIYASVADARGRK